MGSVIGEILPLALGVAISPIPVIAAILMLLSPKARITSVGFLLGWMIGIVVAVTVFSLLFSILPEHDPDASRPIRGTVQLVLGLLLFLLAFVQWRKRPKPGEEAALPKWMKAIDTFTFPVAFGLGFMLAAVNPKNLTMAAGAGTDIGVAALPAGSTTLVVIVYVLVASSTVLVPVVGYLIAAERLRAPLNALSTWLTSENTVIMAVLFVVLGTSMIGKGIGSF